MYPTMNQMPEPSGLLLQVFSITMLWYKWMGTWAKIRCTLIHTLFIPCINHLKVFIMQWATPRANISKHLVMLLLYADDLMLFWYVKFFHICFTLLRIFVKRKTYQWMLRRIHVGQDQAARCSLMPHLQGWSYQICELSQKHLYMILRSMN